MCLKIVSNVWDSDFFGFKTGSIVIDPYCKDEEISTVVEYGMSHGYRLLYLFKKESKLNLACLTDYQIQLVDTKVIFTLTDLQKKPLSPYVHEYVGSPDLLYSLAFQSGRHSRFNIDKNFEKGVFERLYSIWVINSLNKQLADKVFVYELNNELAGFVTVKLHNDKLSIGLIATDEKYRNKGVATMLLNHVINYSIDLQVSTIDVATQYDNLAACSFYRSQAMCQIDKSYIYHLWIK